MAIDRQISVSSKILIEIFCETNNALLGKTNVDHRIVGEFSSLKGRLGNILNEEFGTDIFSEDLVPYQITFDKMSKYLEK